MITLEQAKNLRRGQILHAEFGGLSTPIGPRSFPCERVIRGSAKGRPERWRVSGMVKTWKTRPDEVRVPIKHGLYSSDYLTQYDLESVHLASECPNEDWRE